MYRERHGGEREGRTKLERTHGVVHSELEGLVDVVAGGGSGVETHDSLEVRTTLANERE